MTFHRTYPDRIVAGRRIHHPMGDVGIWDAIRSVFEAGEPATSDKIDQTAGGGATTSAADFITVGGICKPRNVPALEAVRELQRQMNRVAQMKGFGKTAVDGAVGPGTLALFRQVQSVASGSVMGDPSSCMTVAPDADVLAAQIRAVADSLGAPTLVSGPVALTVPTIVTASGKVVAPPVADAGILASIASMPPIQKVALAGVAGGIGYLLFTQAKKRRRR